MIFQFIKKLLGLHDNMEIRGNGNQIIYADNNSSVNAKNNSPAYTHNKIEAGGDIKGNNIAFGQGSRTNGNITYEENVQSNSSAEKELLTKIDELLSYIQGDQGKKELSDDQIEDIEEQSNIIKEKIENKTITSNRLMKFNNFLSPYMNIITTGALVAGVISASTDLIGVLNNINQQS
ncbi:hypothetical protein ACFO25_12255 [Paenactinomyces guangxiensis]|uniref:Uncharacterized protein n=1 Tax=Paenactinomyces guangxiensis TaxID=1490290 RepID=A0A7W1WV42_9BACL|nr:hypothetical protein [Paenactinomyces guangxiensis]MBA4496567.1 hypothetical protein [Paenactinomyces guangxiensis]MBH8593687.1 hypothetical protein [Paenactinomyces guangxiensis]